MLDRLTNYGFRSKFNFQTIEKRNTAVKMKLSTLIPHSSEWLGVPHSEVKTVARVLQPAGLISLGGRGPGGAEMTTDDKINLLLGVCGVEVANRAAEHVRVWRQLVRSDNSTDDNRFAFTRARNVKDFFVGLITDDLNGGALDAWLRESDASFDRVSVLKAHPRHKIVLDFYIDSFAFTIAVSRVVLEEDENIAEALRKSKTETVEVSFRQTPELFDESRELRDKGYKAQSSLIRRLDAENIRGWGACLLDDPK